MKFKVGDKVKIINSFCGHKFKIGEEVIIVNVNNEHKNYAVKNGVEEWNVIETEIEQATNNKFKAGDKVKIINNTYHHHFKIGEIVTITKVSEDKIYRADNDLDFWYVKDEDIKLIGEEKQDKEFNYWHNICEIQAEQTVKGISKYGYPLEQNTWLDINERLRYLQEELVDALMYIEHIKALLNEGVKDESI